MLVSNLLGSLALLAPAHAADVTVDGYVDLRLIHAPDERAWEDGGDGKTRYGKDDNGAKLSDVVGEVTANVAPGLQIFASGRYDEEARTPVDLIEGYVAYNPESTGAFRFGAKAGAFFAPISLENDQIGWAGTWTLTPSAINSWVGEELRTIGLEGHVSWRDGPDQFTAVGALFGANDQAGVLIAARGWALDDRPVGVFDKPRLPDSYATMVGASTPLYTPLFREMDDRAGWYAGLSWSHTGWGKVSVLRYDNNTDATVVQGDAVGWHTAFWHVGLETDIAGFIVKMQGMTGETELTPSPFYDGITHFKSAYLLVGHVFGRWKVAGRVEYFETKADASFGGPYVASDDGSEVGRAVTLNAFWMARDWLQLGGEALYISSTRSERDYGNDDPKQDGLQLQLNARLFY